MPVEVADTLEVSEKLETGKGPGGRGTLCDLAIKGFFARGLSAFPG